jgi:hypothetical protein
MKFTKAHIVSSDKGKLTVLFEELSNCLKQANADACLFQELLLADAVMNLVAYRGIDLGMNVSEDLFGKVEYLFVRWFICWCLCELLAVPPSIKITFC